MTYLQFYNQWHPFACFSTQQVKAIMPGFNRSNYLQLQGLQAVAKDKDLYLRSRYYFR